MKGGMILFVCTACLSLPVLAAPLSVKDDLGISVTLDRPAQRIISLAPHATEMLFAVGAGSRIVGAVDFSNYPEAAKAIPRVGGYHRLDVERIVNLKPDLVIAWRDGNGPPAIDRLKKLRLNVYVTEPVDLPDVASHLRRLSVLVGEEETGQAVAARFQVRYEGLKQRYENARPVSTFYQLWHQPLMTATNSHLIGQVIRLCGGANIFADLPVPTPKVGLEAVLAADPRAIIASGMDEARPEWLDDWRQWPKLRAVSNNHLFFVAPDILQRHSPRILDGADQVCAALDQVRSARGDRKH